MRLRQSLRSVPTLERSFLFLALVALPLAAQAYVGPGAGLSLLSALWGLLCAIGAAFLFVILWPIRRMRRRRREARGETAKPADTTSASTAASTTHEPRTSADASAHATAEPHTPNRSTEHPGEETRTKPRS